MLNKHTINVEVTKEAKIFIEIMKIVRNRRKIEHIS